MSVDLLSNVKHWNEISETFCVRLKCDQHTLEADVTSGIIRVQCEKKRCTCSE